MTLIARATRDRIGADAYPRLASIGLGTSVTVITHTAIRFLRIRTDPGRRIARSGIVTLITRCTRDRIRSDARSRLATIALGASVTIITGAAICLLWI